MFIVGQDQREQPLTARPDTLGSRFSWGTSTSSIRIIPVADALSENFPSILGVDKPFIPRSKIKPRTLPSSHFAQTTAMSATGEFVILAEDREEAVMRFILFKNPCICANYGMVPVSTYQVLAPLMVKVPLDALYLALVSILPGSLPWLGSVKPKQPRISPRAAQQMQK